MVAHGASRGLSVKEAMLARRATLRSRCGVSPSGLWEPVDIPPRLAPWATFCRPPG